MHYITWTKEMEDFLIKNYNKTPINKLTSKFGASKGAIRTKASRLKITNRRKKGDEKMRFKFKTIEEMLLSNCFYYYDEKGMAILMYDGLDEVTTEEEYKKILKTKDRDRLEHFWDILFADEIEAFRSIEGNTILEEEEEEEWFSVRINDSTYQIPLLIGVTIEQVKEG